MSELKATPGEWHVVTGITYCCVRTGSSDSRAGGVIADMRIAGGYYNTFDAHLIAAAPELYAGLLSAHEAMIIHVPGYKGSPLCIANEAALAKARGEQS